MLAAALDSIKDINNVHGFNETVRIFVFQSNLADASKEFRKCHEGHHGASPSGINCIKAIRPSATGRRKSTITASLYNYAYLFSLFYIPLPNGPPELIVGERSWT
jgi:hypothetical protein